MCDVLRREFRLYNFSLRYHGREAFVSSQWSIPIPVYVIYRFLTAAWCTATLLWVTIPAIRNNDGGHNIMCFLTTWTYIALTLYFDTAFLSLVIHLISTCRTKTYHVHNRSTDDSLRRESEVRTDQWSTDEWSTADSERQQLTISEKNTPADDNSGILDAMTYKSRDKITWHMKITWIFGNVIYVSAFLVTIVFYLVLYSSEFANFMDFNLHLLNSVLILFDAFVIARPVRLLHIVYPYLYMLGYLVFSIIYWEQDPSNNVLYENILDYNKPWRTTAAVSTMVIIGIPGIQLLHFGIYRLRLFISYRYCIHGPRYDDI